MKDLSGEVAIKQVDAESSAKEVTWYMREV